MSPASIVRSATRWGCMAVWCMVVVGCASTRAPVEPSGETAGLPPAADPASGPPIGPPPGYVEPTNYWVREKIILTSAQEPSPSPPQKSPVSKGKKRQKTGKRAAE